MPAVLCFGDSNTWGYDGKKGRRFDRDVRWTGVLSGLLGDRWQVIEEGLCGRTIACSAQWEPEINGLAYLPACLKSHAPLDWFVVMLGGNDLQLRFGATPLEIARSLERMLQLVLSPHSHGLGPVPEVLVVSPPPVGEGIHRFFLRELFGGEACIEPSRQLAKRIRSVADTYGCRHLDGAGIVTPCPEDGLHLNAENHRKLAHAVYGMINEKERG